MKLKKLLKFQVLYFALGMFFNAVSIICVSQGFTQLTPTDPYIGCVVMSIYVSFLIPGWYKRISIYRVLMGLSVVLLGYGGVIQHFSNIQKTPELYSSLTAGLIGASINVFGLILNLIAAFGKFEE